MQHNRVFVRFQDEFAERAVSIELDIAPEVAHVAVDRLKLREAVGELLRNVLAALPESGGQLGLRARLSEDGTKLLNEVADDGAGAEQSLIDEAFDAGAATVGRPRVEGLALTKAIVEQHGGSLGVESKPGGGTYAQIRLPLRDWPGKNTKPSFFWSGRCPGCGPGHCPERARDTCPMERSRVFGVVCPMAKVV